MYGRATGRKRNIMSDIIAYKVNEQIVDTQSYCGNGGEEIFFDNSKEALDVIRHSCAHLMAAAIKELYPNAKFFVGPCIEDGFYYDMRVSKSDGEKLGESDLEEIEKR